MEQDIVCKQTFIGSHYAMLDDQYNPLPVSGVGRRAEGFQGKRGASTAFSTAISSEDSFCLLLLFHLLKSTGSPYT